MSRALGDLIDTLINLLNLFILRSTDQIQNLCIRLYYVGRISAAVGDRVMDSCFRNHMLTKELNAYVHQLGSIQSASSKMRRSARMGAGSIEFIIYLIVGERTSCIGSCQIPGMPCDRSVQPLKHAAFCHKCLTGSAFLTRAAKVNNRTGFSGFFQIFL